MPPDRLVTAPGTWASKLLSGLGVNVTVERRVMYWFQPEQGTGPSTADRRIHPEEIDAVAAYLRPRIPALPGRRLKAAACMCSDTPDEHFALAQRPEHPRVTVACGSSGHGFTFVPVTGEILADLATEGTTERPVAPFDPRRVRVRPFPKVTR